MLSLDMTSPYVMTRPYAETLIKNLKSLCFANHPSQPITSKKLGLKVGRNNMLLDMPKSHCNRCKCCLAAMLPAHCLKLKYVHFLNKLSKNSLAVKTDIARIVVHGYEI